MINELFYNLYLFKQQFQLLPSSSSNVSQPKMIDLKNKEEEGPSQKTNPNHQSKQQQKKKGNSSSAPSFSMSYYIQLIKLYEKKVLKYKKEIKSMIRCLIEHSIPFPPSHPSSSQHPQQLVDTFQNQENQQQTLPFNHLPTSKKDSLLIIVNEMKMLRFI